MPENGRETPTPHNELDTQLAEVQPSGQSTTREGWGAMSTCERLSESIDAHVQSGGEIHLVCEIAVHGVALVKYRTSSEKDRLVLQKELLNTRLRRIAPQTTHVLRSPSALLIEVDTENVKMIFAIREEMWSLCLVDYCLTEKDRHLSPDGRGNDSVGFSLLCDANA